jgi:WD40 repeat protein
VIASVNKETQTSAVSPDGTRLVVAHEIWTLSLHMPDGTDKFIFEAIDRPISLPTFSPDGSKFASVIGDTTINVWDTSSGNVLRASRKHGTKITFLAFSPDGTRIITICDDLSETTIEMWKLDANSVITFDNYDTAQAAAFFPDGTRLVTTSASRAMRMWDLTSNTPSLVSTLPASTHDNHLVISSDGTRLALSGGLWDIVNHRQLVSFEWSTRAPMFTSDGKCIAYIDCFKTVHILDAITGTALYRLTGFTHILINSTRLLCLSADGYICILDTRCLPASEFLSCVYSPDCMIVNETNQGGWYLGADGARLIWLPNDLGNVYLATGTQQSESSYLVFGKNTDEVMILDMEDYLDMLPVGAAWRKGGIQYVDSAQAQRACALMSESGISVRICLAF